MKISYLILIAVLITAVITNPSEERHKELLMNKIKPEMIQAFTDKKDLEELNIGDALSVIFGPTLVESFIGNLISVDNYIFFSLTKVTWDKETKAIAIAAFGNMLLLKDLDKLKIRI